MSIRAKLCIASILMVVGIMPLGFCLVWALGFLAVLRGAEAIIPIMDPIGMLGVCAASFFLTLAVAGTSAVWSWELMRDQEGARSWTPIALQVLTCTVLACPAVLIGYLALA